MHETVVAAELIKNATGHANGAGATKILSIVAQVGSLSGIVPESLAFAFEALKPGTLAETAKLILDFVETTCRCANCQTTFSAHSAHFRCEQCGQLAPVADDTDGLLLIRLTVE